MRTGQEAALAPLQLGDNHDLRSISVWFLPLAAEGPRCVRLCTQARNQILWATWEEAGHSSFLSKPGESAPVQRPSLAPSLPQSFTKETFCAHSQGSA